MALNADAKNLMLEALADAVTHLGLANNGVELPGATVYARQAVVWSAATGGLLAMSGTETFSIPAATTIDEVIFRDSATIGAGNSRGGAPITEEVFGGAGTYQLNTLEISLIDA
jgi:hypothetical protein